jgi:formylglycine-generating enzyme required for sulfatase activity
LGDDQRLRALLEKLAYEAHRQETAGEGSELLFKDLLSLLEQPAYPYLGDLSLAGAFLGYIDQRTGLLVGHGGSADGGYPQTYAFPHRTFQEYLAGCAMVGQQRRGGMVREYWRRAEDGALWSLAARLGSEELLYNRRRTEELLDLAYGLAPEVAPTDEGDWRATLWSGQMAALLGPEAVVRDTERPDGGQAYLDRLIPRLLHIMRAAPLGAIERAEAGDVLATLGDPRFRPDAWYLPDEPLLGFVEIPEGEFLMGEDEKQHKVILPRYYIARYPVTVAQFRAFVEASGLESKDADSLLGLANHPVVWVNWYEALAYCHWLTEVLRDWAGTPKTLAELLRAEWRVTLPSEAEWEKAARGTDGRLYPWGDVWNAEKCNSVEGNKEDTTPVGTYPQGASPYGVLDMAGNVWEWTRSLWGESYPYDPDDGREDIDATGSRVRRGGAFDGLHKRMRCACRDYDDPNLPWDSYGFRVCIKYVKTLPS